MYHGVGAGSPTCAPQEIINLAKRDCAQQIKRVGALPEPWADMDPCGIAMLPPCLPFKFTPFTFDTEPEGYSEEIPGGGGEEEGPSGALVIGGILLLLVAAGGGYYIYRRAKRKV